MNSLSSLSLLASYASAPSQLRIFKVVCAPWSITSLCITASLPLLVCAGVVRPQSEGMVVATVHGTELRLVEVGRQRHGENLRVATTDIHVAKVDSREPDFTTVLAITCDSALPSIAVTTL